ncbi:Uncharacterised protein [Klebsiella michiganensis]|uniref:Uncharacterized protein n=1 Tax=Klebsiella michiganensis TaxID=1134687 RepID=A0A7H4MX54_9ENTR|nr:Uncharacterised protein [Klebsiella michiganensis]
MVEDVARLTIFHRASGVHHQHLIADPGDDAEIVGNHNDRRIELALELIKQCHYLRLHGYVQRRCRLIGNQQLRPAQQRHRNHDALAHPAGKLVRIHFHRLRASGILTASSIFTDSSKASALLSALCSIRTSISCSPTRIYGLSDVIGS